MKSFGDFDEVSEEDFESGAHYEEMKYVSERWESIGTDSSGETFIVKESESEDN